MSGVVCLEEVASFLLDRCTFLSMAALPGGRRFATGHDNTIRVRTTAGDLVATLEGHASFVTTLASTPSGAIISGSCDRTVKVWHDCACVRTLHGHDGDVYAVALSPLDDTIVSGSEDHTAKVWSASTGECVATLEGHIDWVCTVCVLDNGDVVTGSLDDTLRVWERGSWTCTAVHQEPDDVWCVAGLSGGGLAVAGGSYGSGGFVSVWRGGKREWSVATTTEVNELAAIQDMIVVSTKSSAYIIHDGVCVKQWDAEYARVAVLSKGSLVMATNKDGAFSCKVYRVVRPSRLATIHIMITAWSAHGGVPPPASDAETTAAVLGRTLSLRRLCRPRVDGDAVEVVEPFAKDVVGYV